MIQPDSDKAAPVFTLAELHDALALVEEVIFDPKHPLAGPEQKARMELFSPLMEYVTRLSGRLPDRLMPY